MLCIAYEGKTFGWAFGSDVTYSIEIIKYYAGWADKLSGQTPEVVLHRRI